MRRKSTELVSIPLEEEGGSSAGKFKIDWFKGLKEDFAKRLPLYKSDITDGFQGKTLPAILFLYFACLAPAVAFGGITYGLTKGKDKWVVGCDDTAINPPLFLPQSSLTCVHPSSIHGRFHGCHRVLSILWCFRDALCNPFWSTNDLYWPE